MIGTLKDLSEGFETITSQKLFEIMCEYYKLPIIEEYLRELADKNTVRLYIATSGFQIDWAGTGDHYTVL